MSHIAAFCPPFLVVHQGLTAPYHVTLTSIREDSPDFAGEQLGAIARQRGDGDLRGDLDVQLRQLVDPGVGKRDTRHRRRVPPKGQADPQQQHRERQARVNPVLLCNTARNGCTADLFIQCALDSSVSATELPKESELMLCNSEITPIYNRVFCIFNRRRMKLRKFFPRVASFFSKTCRYSRWF